MSKKKFILDDTTLPSAEQLAEIQRLIAEGKDDEARATIAEIRRQFEDKKKASNDDRLSQRGRDDLQRL